MFTFGPPVTGKNFINRSQEIERILYEIESRNNLGSCEFPHIEISSSRRIGKSSILMEMSRILSDDERGYTPIYIQLIDLVKIVDFFNRLRAAVLASLPPVSGVAEFIKKHAASIKVNPFKAKTSFSSDGEFKFDPSDIVSLRTVTQWQEVGIETFKLLRKYNKLKFVIFLDEMGFVRKVKEEDKTVLEFLNFLNNELSKQGTPVFVLCGSQNFFHILQDINPEVYQLWKRQFWRVTVGCFDHDASVNKLLIPNFKQQEYFTEPLFTDSVMEGLANFVYKVSSGYPSMMQIMGKDISFLVKYGIQSGRIGEQSTQSENSPVNVINMDSLKEIVINRAFWDNIVADKQSLCHELLSEEALGSDHKAYRELIYHLYCIKTNSIKSLPTAYTAYELDSILKKIEELQYITLKGDRYDINYNFLKYNLWHPRYDDNIQKEVNELWLASMKIT
jgi:hypothetical protein